jgi:repressor LexA
MKGELTNRQKKVLDVIREHIQQYGYPPTQEEIAVALDIEWTRAVEKHLQALEKKGYIRKDKGARAIRLLSQNKAVPIPLIGTIAAGGPIIAEEHIERFIALDAELLPGAECFFLRVQGDSMRGAGILNDDLVLVKSQAVGERGDILAFLLEGAVTVKYFFPEEKRIILRPANPSYHDIVVEEEAEVRVLGKVIASLRCY